MKLKLKIKAEGSPGEVTSALHPGFKKVASMIASKGNVSNPSAVLAASSRNASMKAKKKNPRLLKVK